MTKGWQRLLCVKLQCAQLHTAVRCTMQSPKVLCCASLYVCILQVGFNHGVTFLLDVRAYLNPPITLSQKNENYTCQQYSNLTHFPTFAKYMPPESKRGMDGFQSEKSKFFQVPKDPKPFSLGIKPRMMGPCMVWAFESSRRQQVGILLSMLVDH